jgi:hypothetical protein
MTEHDSFMILISKTDEHYIILIEMAHPNVQNIIYTTKLHTKEPENI